MSVDVMLRASVVVVNKVVRVDVVDRPMDVTVWALVMRRVWVWVYKKRGGKKSTVWVVVVTTVVVVKVVKMDVSVLVVYAAGGLPMQATQGTVTEHGVV